MGLSDEPQTSEGIKRRYLTQQTGKPGWVDGDWPSDGLVEPDGSAGDGWLPDPEPEGGWMPDPSF